jgi:hypothetical protein
MEGARVQKSATELIRMLCLIELHRPEADDEDSNPATFRSQ